MAEGRLPAEGPVRIGPVSLPPGRLITGHPDPAIAWATVDPVPESGRVWAALSELHPQTGLVPIQLDGLPADSLRWEGLGRDDLRPWDSGEFQLPEDLRDAHGLDVGAVLEDLWDGWVPPDGGDPEEQAMREPFSLQFPGLAPPGRTPLTPAERQRALDEVLPRIRESDRATPAARIGLIPAVPPMCWRCSAGKL
jgi:hypothetical protein